MDKGIYKIKIKNLMMSAYMNKFSAGKLTIARVGVKTGLAVHLTVLQQQNLLL